MMYKDGLKRAFVVLLGLLMSLALLSGCTLFNQKPITITKVNNVSLQVDETKNITVTTTPGDVIIKTVSNNPSIATVSVNKNVLTIKGKAEGEAEITITATKSGSKTASLKFKAIVSKLPSKPNIVIVSSLADIEVAYRTLFENIGLPDEVEVTLDDQTKQTLEVEWDEGNYDGNSTGTYNLEGNLILVEGITNNSELRAKINVIVPVAATGDLRSVKMPVAKKVPYEAEFVDLDLPTQVKVKLDDGSEICLDVEWISGNYDGTREGEVYIVEGNLMLCSGITNTLNLNVTIEITVNIPPKIIDLTPTEGTYRLDEYLYFLLFAEDADQDNLTYRWKDNEIEIDFYPYDDPTNFGYAFQELGRHEVVVQVSDGFNEIEEMLIFKVNAYPEITSLKTSEAVIKIDEEITIEVDVVDHEDDDLTYRWVNNNMTIEGEECSSLTWTPTEFGTYDFGVYISDGNGGSQEVYDQTKIEVVENYIPEIKKITGPKNVVINQKDVIFTAEYDHRDKTKELTIHWETNDGTIIEGQDTNEIKWYAPAVQGNSCLTFVVDDGVTAVRKDIHVFVEEPSISINCVDTVGAGQKCDLFIHVHLFYEADIDISVISSDGELISIWESDAAAQYNWIAPKELGNVTFDIEIIIDGVLFDRSKVVSVGENNKPVIHDILVNNDPINPEEFLILNPNEEYNFHIDVIDPDGEELSINWNFYDMNYQYEPKVFSGYVVNYVFNSRSVVRCNIEINDGVNEPVYTSINMVFDDGSVSELPDQNKVQAMETIIDDFELMFEQNDIEIMVKHLHPDTEFDLRLDLQNTLEIGKIMVVDRDVLIFDSFLDIYKTYVLVNFELIYGEIVYGPVYMAFKDEDNGVIKLYDLSL